MDFWAMMFHKSTRTDKNAYLETACLCEILNYKNTVTFFVCAHADVISRTQQSGMSEEEALSPCTTQKWRF